MLVMAGFIVGELGGELGGGGGAASASTWDFGHAAGELSERAIVALELFLGHEAYCSDLVSEPKALEMNPLRWLRPRRPQTHTLRTLSKLSPCDGVGEDKQKCIQRSSCVDLARKVQRELLQGSRCNQA